ncbi:uncharacterized protein LOC133926009 [Phragmites australis]|uniref:uncharacterized protein LOC133926009 n=1 Tax=Phragmites australis TaxID=29695 RepID=UPI002D788338|nr:uncharacterized protein LOC133926009 [Phragmites australis]
MRRRRWARVATALYLAIVVVLQLAVDVAAHGTPLSSLRAHGHAHRGRELPPSASVAVHHAVARAKLGGRAGAAVGFDAAAADARCKSLEQKTGGAGGRAAACGDDDDDKRRIPTGPNPLHNR